MPADPIRLHKRDMSKESKRFGAYQNNGRTEVVHTDRVNEYVGPLSVDGGKVACSGSPVAQGLRLQRRPRRGWGRYEGRWPMLVGQAGGSRPDGVMGQ